MSEGKKKERKENHVLYGHYTFSHIHFSVYMVHVAHTHTVCSAYISVYWSCK